jgi:hypothetical protein
MSTQAVVSRVDPSIVAYLDNVALADQSLQFAVWARRIAPEQAPAMLRDRAARLAAVDLRGLDPSVVAEHRASMTQLMQQIEWAIASSNQWPPERTPGDYRAIAQRTLQQLRADYEQKLARGIAPTATAHALLVVFAWTRGEGQPAMADWIAGEQLRVQDATEAILTGAAAGAVTPRPGTPSPPIATGAAAPSPSPTQAASTPATTSGAGTSARSTQTPQSGAPAGVPIYHGNRGFGSWQLGMDIFNGADYRSLRIGYADPAACLAECARDARCRAVTYTMPGTYGAAEGVCWFKGQTGTFGPHSSAISAVKLGATTPAATTPPPVGTTPPPIAMKAPPAANPPLVQCDIGGQWRMNTQNVGQSTWTFSSLGGNQYSGQETGLGNASGTAIVNGDSLRLEWRTGGYSGVVELRLDANCSSGQGRQVFHTGRTGSEASTWTRIGVPPPAAKPPQPVTPPVAATPGGLAGQWNGPAGVYQMTHTGNSFTWRVGGEVGQGTISGDNLQVTWTGGGSATGRITERTPQGLPIVIAWSNGVVFKRVGY